MKSREFIRKFLIPIGAILERKDSDHWIYRLPSGRTIIVPVGGSQGEIASYLVPKLKRLLRSTEPTKGRRCSR